MMARNPELDEQRPSGREQPVSVASRRAGDDADVGVGVYGL